MWDITSEESGGIEAFVIFEAKINGVEDSLKELQKSFCNLKCSSDQVVKETLVFKNNHEQEELKSNDHKVEECGCIACLVNNEEQVVFDQNAQLESVKNDDEKEPSASTSGSTSHADAIDDLVQKILQEEEEELAKIKLKEELAKMMKSHVLEKNKVEYVPKKVKVVNRIMKGVLEKDEVESASKKQEKKKSKMEHEKKREEEEAKKKKNQLDKKKQKGGG